MRYVLHLAYNGTRFCGWQIQPNAPSIQEEIENALSTIIAEKISIYGAGRTDTGVHAKSYFAHFDTNKILSSQDIVYKLNRILSNDIVIYGLYSVDNQFHARFSATSRTYTYTITQQKDPFTIETEYYCAIPLNLSAMNNACELLLGTHDFSSFSKLHTDVNNNICTITYAKWTQKDKKLIFTISANRFLRNMVRAIVGTLIDIGKEKTSILEFSQIIESKNRQNAGQSIPAHGLSLIDIQYSKDFPNN